MARNPEEGSSLPYLVRVPLPDGAVVLKVHDVWPRTAKVYCHRAHGWPEEPDIVERVAVRLCQRRGAAVDLVLDRARENRSQFVFTKARGRDVIFWQSARTSRQARPNVSVPTARSAGQCSRSSSERSGASVSASGRSLLWRRAVSEAPAVTLDMTSERMRMFEPAGGGEG